MPELDTDSTRQAVRPHHRFWPKRLPHALTPPATSLWHNLAVNAQRYPDKPALVFFDRTTSYLTLFNQAERLAAHLHAQGVQDGDRVILFMQNCPQWVVAHFAILRANAVVVPVNPMNRAEELKHYITDPDAKVAICAADLASELLKANAELPEQDRLRHLVVSHYHDAMGPQAEMPGAWTDWLQTRHPLPAMAGGSVADWADALACTDEPPVHDQARRSGGPALHQWHHRTAQGLHAHPWHHHAQRRGRLRVGQQHIGDHLAGGGAHVPHHRHGGGHACRPVHRRDDRHHAALGP